MKTRVKVKVKIDYNKIRKAIVKQSKKTLPAIFKQQIVDFHIKRGKSPVKGVRYFKKYSAMYKRQIRAGKYNEHGKDIKPVNLTLTGKLLKSFYVKYKSTYVIIGFKDSKAAENNDLRPMLPIRGGQEFHPKILRVVKKHMTNIAYKVIKLRTK